MESYEKRFLSKDGQKRVTIFRDEDAENPRYLTDEPLHCEDWDRNCTIMTYDERKGRSYSAREAVVKLLSEYGDEDKILSLLCKNSKHMEDGRSLFNNALIHDSHQRCWVLKVYTRLFHAETFAWEDEEFFFMRKDEIDVAYLLQCLEDDTLDVLIASCLTDRVKVEGYSFGYYGDVSFGDEVTTRSEGIAWLDKDEFLKYAGHDESYWTGKTLREVEWLIGEVESYSEGDVWCATVEERYDYKVHRECTNREEKTNEYAETEWKETDTCGGIYGNLDKNIDQVFELCCLFAEDFEEVNVI